MHIVYILCMGLLNFVNLLLACWILLEEIRKGWKLQALVQSQNGVYIKPWAVRWWVWIKDLSHSEFGDVEAQLDPWKFHASNGRLQSDLWGSHGNLWQSMAIYGYQRYQRYQRYGREMTWWRLMRYGSKLLTPDALWTRLWAAARVGPLPLQCLGFRLGPEALHSRLLKSDHFKYIQILRFKIRQVV